MKLTAPCLTGLLVLLLATGVPRPAAAAPFDGRPKILLHLAGTTTKNQCAPGQLSDCGAAVIAGDLAGAGGPFYFAYVLGTRGDMPDVAGVEFGIRYQDGCITGQQDGQGIDVFSWTSCGTASVGSIGTYAWPAPGGGNYVIWDHARCQSGETAVAGYFYVGCYGTADTLRIAPRPVSGVARLAECSSTYRVVAETDLGSVVFSPGGGSWGCNPCNGPCQAPPTYLTCSAVSDINPPAPVVLSIVDIGATFVTLGWTATGDNGFSGGPATTYELHYYSDSTPWTKVGGMPTPPAPGTLQSTTITGLNAEDIYYFQMRVADEVPNWSELSFFEVYVSGISNVAVQQRTWTQLKILLGQ